MHVYDHSRTWRRVDYTSSARTAYTPRSSETSITYTDQVGSYPKNIDSLFELQYDYHG
jgi:hypothetical protein